MADYVNVKLRYTNDELVGVLTKEENECIVIEYPLNIKIHPVHGYYAKSWLLLSESNTVVLQRTDILHYGKASYEAIDFYEEYVERLSEVDNVQFESVEDLDKYSEEVEDYYVTLMDSKEAIKH